MKSDLSGIDNKIVRDSFSSRFGFILSCIGSSVGMGNIWLFPYRLGQYGGGAFLLLFTLFVVIIGFSGVIGEMAFGRAMGTGPWGAFKKAIEMKGWRFGKNLGLIPVFGSLLIAIGYSVVVGWIIYFLKGAVTNEVLSEDSQLYFENMLVSHGSIVWYIIGMLFLFFVMSCGVSRGIENLNRIMMPIFFIIFIILAVKVYFTPGSSVGYEFLFVLDWSYLSSPKTWVYALGQAFFSLSLAGSGTIIYGSYLKKSENIIYCAGNVVLFDMVSAILSSFVIIPAVFMFSLPLNSGPSLLFITMPQIFSRMIGGQIFCIIFFIAVLFAAFTSLINLFETPVEMLQYRLGMPRGLASGSILILSALIGLLIEKWNIVAQWMDMVSIYIIPLGALLAGIIFFWICGKNFAREQIQLGREKRVGRWLEPVSRYVFIGITFVVYIIGMFYGGIG